LKVYEAKKVALSYLVRIAGQDHREEEYCIYANEKKDDLPYNELISDE